MSYGAARKALSEVVQEAELVLAQQASADRVDRMRKELDEAVEVHLAQFGFDRVES